MSEVPGDRKYSREHEWVRLQDDGLVMIGLTDHAQEALGELVYVEQAEDGATLAKGDACIVVESVKAASDVYAPIGGVLAEVNDALTDEPELVNQSPYEEGWLVRIEPSDPVELDELMDADAYSQFLAESAG
ncbi:MAG TPA: glycine cleavage system protein GcvH [Gammaproteobacteria bacterium]|jgi:glycine cleavage system H protein|nr:glycine cleavage system protein H [Chromatiales bacterium]MCP4926566.1 glycine cleavage system protein GcvH [Gammaproteobacteria bacterium]MDP7153262.1 glycine cleavage system protein GcvH [Gammaproteobacteria bacterium]MDP7296123.1 glycine cleavage system protein GcvH [Gammaproteobacteria bacterium]MDP7660752.1 glycine cleavage system protein GcvH [Gammaproteobacteria bacterium]